MEGKNADVFSWQDSKQVFLPEVVKLDRGLNSHEVNKRDVRKLTLQKFVEKLSKSVDLTSFDLVKYYQHEKQQIVITIEVDFESCHDI